MTLTEISSYYIISPHLLVIFISSLPKENIFGCIFCNIVSLTLHFISNMKHAHGKRHKNQVKPFIISLKETLNFILNKNFDQSAHWG